MASIPELSETEWQALLQRAIAMPDAPPELEQRALDLWRLHGIAPRETPGLRRWAAVLQFDSWAGAAMAAGMRALPSEVRQLVFSAQGCDIDLRVAPGPHGYALSGQLLGVEGAGRVELSSARPGIPSCGAELNALGEFRIDGLGSDRYRITVRLGSEEIELPPIDVGLPRSATGP